jgi:hypothetical protein
MCIWDRLARYARQCDARTFTPKVEITPPTTPALPMREHPGMRPFAIRASLHIEYYVSEELVGNEHAMAMFERDAREQLAALLYEDVLKRLARIEEQVQDGDYPATMFKELRDYMTRDEARGGCAT